jgi:hypothetical protein
MDDDRDLTGYRDPGLSEPRWESTIHCPTVPAARLPISSVSILMTPYPAVTIAGFSIRSESHVRQIRRKRDHFGVQKGFEVVR